MRARIDTVSNNRFDMGVILVYIQCERVISLDIANARMGISKENTRGVGISQEKSTINPGMGQLMVEGGCPMVRWYPYHTIVMYVYERKSSV